MFRSSDHEWNQFGAENPYYGVLSDERMDQKNLTEETLLEFWRTGEEHINSVFLHIHHHICPNFKPENALDFGCGVGRLLFALHKRCSHVTGVDVSAPMLAEARRQAERKSIDNLTLVESSDCNDLGVNQFDLVHSYIVLQHIPVDRGYAILDKLLASLRSGGVGVLHLTFSQLGYNRWKITRMIPFNKQWRNFVDGKPLNAPFMQMNEYNLNKILSRIMDVGVKKSFLELTDHDGSKGAIIYFQKA